MSSLSDFTILDAQWLRQLCLDAGADDVGFVDIDRPELGNERTDIVRFFQPTKALISFILRMNREPIRSPARSPANVEFHQTGEGVNEVAHHIVTALGNRGVRAINPAMGFPMEVDRVGNSLNRLRSISAFLAGLRLTFQRGQSKGIAATYHFTFTGDEDRKATVVIRAWPLANAFLHELRPTRSRRRRSYSDHLPGSGAVRHVRNAVPFGGHHE
jgi:hypothetical protein